MPLPHQAEAFLEMMAVERDASPNTLAAYGRDLDDAETHLADQGGLNGASAEAVEAFFAGLSRRGLSPATAARPCSMPAWRASRSSRSCG